MESNDGKVAKTSYRIPLIIVALPCRGRCLQLRYEQMVRGLPAPARRPELTALRSLYRGRYRSHARRRAYRSEPSEKAVTGLTSRTYMITGWLPFLISAILGSYNNRPFIWAEHFQKLRL